MTKITEKIKEAFDNNVSIKIDNSEVIFDKYRQVTEIYLFGNLIARKSVMGTEITNAGWFSNTIKERLSALIPIRAEKEKWYYYLNDQWNLWNGSWVRIE